MKTETKKLLTASALVFFLLRDFEKLRLRPYNDGAGKMSVGYGHLILPTDNFKYPITKEQAEELLREDVEKHQEIIYRYVKVPLTQQQHDALVSFAFNIGEGQFQESGLLRELNKGNYSEVPRRLMMYIHGTDEKTGEKMVMRGLVRRRRAEVDLWNGEYFEGKVYP